MVLTISVTIGENTMTYWSCFYHIVWATYRRQELILPQYESMIVAKIREKSISLDCIVKVSSCFIFNR